MQPVLPLERAKHLQNNRFALHVNNLCNSDGFFSRGTDVGSDIVLINDFKTQIANIKQLDKIGLKTKKVRDILESAVILYSESKRKRGIAKLVEKNNVKQQCENTKQKPAIAEFRGRIIVDHRGELGYIDNIKKHLDTIHFQSDKYNKNIIVDSARNKFGDVVIEVDKTVDGKVETISQLKIERKQIFDLCNSISDGRIQRQILSSENDIVLIEGELRTLKAQTDKARIEKMADEEKIVNVITEKQFQTAARSLTKANIPLIFVRSPNRTASFYANLMSTILSKSKLKQANTTNHNEKN